MLATPHILIGAAIGKAVPENFWAVVVLGILSHYLVDALPHFDQAVEGKPKIKQYIIAALDIVVGVLALYLILNSKASNLNLATPIILGAAAALFPDFLDNLPVFSDWLHKNKFFNQEYWFHNKIQWASGKKWMFWGILTQILVVGICVWYLLK